MDITYKSESDEYTIAEQIGEGGTSKVCRARSKVRGKDVAIKLFNSHESNDEVFVHEASILEKIRHANIISPIDSGYDLGSEFIVMPLVDGLNLSELLTKNDIEEFTFISFAIQALEALSVLHSKRILHLDIKPSNIMVKQLEHHDIFVSLIDFGSSKRKSTRPSERIVGKRGLKGSVHFMSPEQINREVLDERSDIYSLGCVFYKMLTKRNPFQGDDAIEVINSHMKNMHIPINKVVDSAPSSICALIERMISAKREDRPASAMEVFASIYMYKLARRNGEGIVRAPKPLS